MKVIQRSTATGIEIPLDLGEAARRIAMHECGRKDHPKWYSYFTEARDKLNAGHVVATCSAIYKSAS